MPDAASTALVLIDLQRGIATGTTLPNAAPDVMAAREGDLHEHSVRRIFPTLGGVRALDVVLAAPEEKAR
jgi:hypothetical protein